MKNLRGKSKEAAKKAKAEKKEQKLREKDLKKKRKRSKRKYLLYYILFFLLLATVFSILSLTVLFKIENIKIVSDAPYSESEIMESLGVKKGDNLLRASEKLAEENLSMRFPYIASVDFRRHLPDELVVTIEKEIPAISAEEEGRTVILSQKGKALEIMTSQNNKGLPRSCGLNTEGLIPGNYINEKEDEKLAILNNLISCLENEGIEADVIDIRDLSAIRILYDGRIDIYFGGSFEHDYKAAFAKKAIDSLDENFVGIADVSKRPTARLRPMNIYMEENWKYPAYLLSDYEKILTVKPNAISPSEAIPDSEIVMPESESIVEEKEEESLPLEEAETETEEEGEEVPEETSSDASSYEEETGEDMQQPEEKENSAQ